MIKQYLNLPRAIHVLCVGAFINRAGTFLVPFLTLYLQKELGLSTGFATRAMGAYGFGSIVAFLAGGHLADLIGRRAVMLISLCGGAAILLIFGSLSSPWMITLALVCFAVVAEMYRPAASAMIADLVSSDHRAHAFSLMYVSINLGFSAAAAIGGWLAQYSFQWLFLGDALTAMIYAVIIFATIRETLPPRLGTSGNSALKPAGQGNTKNDTASTPLAEAIVHILRDRVFMIFCLGTFCVAVVIMQALSTFPLHLQARGMGADTYGRIIAVNGLMIAFLQLPTTSLAARFDRGLMVVLSAVITTIGFGLIGVAVTPWHFTLTVVIWTCGEMINAPLTSAIVSDLAPVHLRARYMGVFSMCFSVALMIGVPLGGMVLERFGGDHLWGGSAAVGMTAAALYWVVRRQMRPPPSRDSS
ncbi:MAG: MFS transporter [Phycisphaerales bacterium]|nr:MAG: MFS transporter [Phycisphaerales bacterium]